MERTKIWSRVTTGHETKNDCADEDQQQFTELDWTESQPTFRNKMSPPTSGSGKNPSKKPGLFDTCFMLVSCLAYPS
jgi:hypothetical protein